jgi:GDP-L-fucose synthase
MCESYNLQYGTNFISAMPTNLYGPNDNFDLEKSHVLPALMRKIHLAKALEENAWDKIRFDLDRLPIEKYDGRSKTHEIISILTKYGITKSPSNSVDVEVWGSGKPRRELLWSDDMADACVFLMENYDFRKLDNLGDRNLTNTHINIGSGIDISIKDLALMIKSLVGYQGHLVFNSSKPDGTMKKLTDVSKINQLGWKNKIELSDGIERLYKWYINN